MKKTFKKSIACLLAVLMVLFSVPFSAFAASLSAAEIINDRHWWEDDGIAIEDIKAEPTYWGYNSPEDPEHQPMGPWYNNFGQAIDISDDSGWEDHRNDYKPVIGVTVSGIGVDGQTAAELKNVYNKYYGAKDIDYATAKSEGYLLNPAELKAGQRIAVTLEFGGFDVINNGQFKGTYDTEYLQAGYYKQTPARNDTWTDIVGSSAFAWASTTNTLGYYGDALASAGENTNDGNFYLGFAGKTAMAGGANYSNFLGTGSEPLDGDPATVRSFGEYGIVGGTITFEVLQDCDLTDVFHFTSYETDSIDDPTWTENGTMFEPFNRDTLDGPSVITVDGDTNGINVFARAPIIWSEYSAGAEEPSHEHEYGTPSYVWDGTSCTATAVCSTCEEGTDGHTVTETVTGALKGEATLPDCTTEGSATYTATFTNPLFTEQETTITTPANGHTFGDEYAHVPDSEPGQHAKKCTVCGALDTENAVACDYQYAVTTDPTCVDAGKGTYTCPVCHDSYTVVIPATGIHTNDYSNVSYSFNDDKTVCTATIGCSVCGGTAATVDSTRVEVTTDGATCQTPGETTYKAIFEDENLTYSETVTGEKAPHSYDYENAEYTWTGTTACHAKATCTVCGETVEADATEITSAVTIEPTCQEKGTTTYTAVFAQPFKNTTTTAQDVPTVEHNYSVLVSEKQDATVDAPGKEAVYKCQWCDATIGGEEIAQLEHYTITATAVNGDAEVQGVSELGNVAVNGDVTLVATADEGYTFVGWSLNDKIVSTEETYTTKAIANAAYVAIYELAEADSQFTVVFTDQYGNVYSTQTVSAGTDVVTPADPTLAGFTFKGWSMTDEEIDALTANATIVANFERAAADQYVVTVNGDCTIAGVDDAKTTTVDYNTMVTVNAPEGAVNGTWKVGDAAVAYGTSYTFLVGADITLTYEEDASVTAEPTVAAVSTDRDANSHKVAFLATRSLTDGCEYIAAGFVYGKNLTEDDLLLANVGELGTGTDSGVVKVGYCSTDSDQFRLSYGLTAMSGTVSAKAFLAYVDSEGNTHITYGALQTYTY